MIFLEDVLVACLIELAADAVVNLEECGTDSVGVSCPREFTVSLIERVLSEALFLFEVL